MALRSYRAPGILLGLAAASWLLAEPHPARAEVAEEAEADSIIMIASRQYEASTLKVIRAIEGQISDLPVTLRIEWIEQQAHDIPAALAAAESLSERTAALAVFWCDLSRAEEVYLYLSDRGQRRVLVRRLDAGDEGVRFESLAVIVHSVVAAMLKGAKIGMEAEPGPEQPQADGGAAPAEPLLDVAAKKTDLESRRFAAAVGYDISGHSQESPVIHGLVTRLSVTVLEGLYVFAEYIFRAPIEVEEQEIALTIKTHPISAGLGHAWRLDRLKLGLRGGFTADFISQRTRRVAAEEAVSVDNDDFVASLVLGLTAEIAVAESVALGLEFAAQANLNGVRYVAMDSTGEEITVDEPWRIAPHGIIAAVFLF